MVPPLTPNVVRRIAYSRFLYEEGVRYSRRPAPLSATALLSFHDAVENFLGIAIDHLQVKVNPKIDFMEYWGRVKSETGLDLPGKTPMNRLNNARVGLKHHGNFPAAETIEQSREAVLAFFSAATPMVFGVNFETIDMSDLVTQPKVAELLHAAQGRAESGDYVDAMAGLSLAFEALMAHYSGGYSQYGMQQSPFAFGPRMDGRDKPHPPKNDVERSLAKVVDVLGKVQGATRMASLGIDYTRYARFTAIAPKVYGYANGTWRYTQTSWHEELTAEDYSSSRSFVIESALQAARADGVHELLEAHREAYMKYSRRGVEPFPERTWNGPTL
jgi:hypothetical protein